MAFSRHIELMLRFPKSLLKSIDSVMGRLLTYFNLGSETQKERSPATRFSVRKYSGELEALFNKNVSVVFLCGPTLSDLSNAGARLRKKLLEQLEAEGFEVVLGEDDGLENLRQKFNGYAHLNELQFIQGHCNAVVLIASSVGAYCELGLFAFDQARGADNQTDFILIIPERFEGVKSYLNEGPAAAINDFGKVFYSDFDGFDSTELVLRLKRRRHVYVTSRRGER